MLHRVQPGPVPAFAPNARLTISPEYLHTLLAGFRAANIDVISMDEALARIRSSQRTRRFVCFTFDDGYRDNLDHALPVFRRFHAPYTVYATTSFVERALAPWWVALEHVIMREREVRWTEARPAQVLSDASSAMQPAAAKLRCSYARLAQLHSDLSSAPWHATDTVRFETSSLAAKQRAFGQLSARFLQMQVAELSLQLERFLSDHGLSMRQLAERELCSWSDLRSLQDAGVEIGCHAVSHARLSYERASTVRDELDRARSLLEAKLGQPVRHLAYPYGKREHVGPRELAIASELGFKSAVTTRPGCLFAAHAAHPHALPRIEVTSAFSPSPHYLQTILAGLPVLARNRGRLVIND